jgi:hypothetical protein
MSTLCVNIDLNAFKNYESTVEHVQMMMRAMPAPWTEVQATAGGRVLAPHRLASSTQRFWFALPSLITIAGLLLAVLAL